MYITASLWAEMLAAWGGIPTHVKTSTNTENGEVIVARAISGEAGAVPLRSVGALNTVEFSFFRPLRKLHLKVPADRQFNVVPLTRQHPTAGTLFVFPMAQRVSVPRNHKEEAAAESSEKSAPAQQGPAK